MRTKDPMEEGYMDIDKSEQEQDPKLMVYNRYRILCSTFVRIATMACASKVRSSFVVKYTNELITKLKEISLGQACSDIVGETTLQY